MEAKETLAMVKGQAEIWQQMYSFVDSLALKCAMELRIADIIYSYGGPITLHQIADGIDSSSPDIPYLARIMRLLASPEKHFHRTSSFSRRW